MADAEIKYTPAQQRIVDAAERDLVIARQDVANAEAALLMARATLGRAEHRMNSINEMGDML